MLMYYAEKSADAVYCEWAEPVISRELWMMIGGVWLGGGGFVAVCPDHQAILPPKLRRCLQNIFCNKGHVRHFLYCFE